MRLIIDFASLELVVIEVTKREQSEILRGGGLAAEAEQLATIARDVVTKHRRASTTSFIMGIPARTVDV